MPEQQPVTKHMTYLIRTIRQALPDSTNVSQLLDALQAAVDITDEQMGAYTERLRRLERDVPLLVESFVEVGSLATLERLRAAEPPQEWWPPPVCPECRAGKHGNCDGRAFDVVLDDIVDCACPVQAQH